MRLTVILALLFVLVMPFGSIAAPTDTVAISVEEFIRMAESRSAMLQAGQQDVELARNRVRQARSQRFVPNLELTTAHGLVPGVISRDPAFNERSYYLDPNLENNWEDWALFTRAEVSALQPLYTWGAIESAVNAARKGVQAAQAAFDGRKADFHIQLYELYYARLLAIELQRLIEDASRTLETAERQLNEFLETGEHDIEEADVFQFRIFRFQFYSQVDEVNENARFLESAWNLALGNDHSDVVFMPAESFLDPIEHDLRELAYYETQAGNRRPEVRQIESVYAAAQHGLEISRATQYPALFMGLSAAFARTPNRPRQANPFIRNTTNFENLQYGIGFRQNLNFSVTRNQINRSELQLRQARYAREAVQDGVRLDLRDQYRRMMMSYSRLQNTREALGVSNEWLRMEQIDYDLGFGDVKNLVDALKANLELEVQLRQRIFDFNVNAGKLNNAAGLPIVPGASIP